MTWDGTTAKLYLNGVLDKSGPMPGTISYLENVAPVIGLGNTSEFDHAKGMIDDVRVYNYALTPEAIEALYSGCIDPVGAEGVLLYHEVYNVPQYCNGREWAALAKLNPAAGGSGCANPSAPEGVILYHSVLHVPQFCDGDDWVAMGAFPYCPTATGGDGYFVITAGTWDGNLQAASGMAEGFAAANKLCLDDLTANDWQGKADAQARGLLNAAHIKAFIGGGDPNSEDEGAQYALPGTTYFFAVSGDATKGGASFTTNAAGQGPGNADNWSGASYFAGDKEYWGGRHSEFGHDLLWPTNNPWAIGCGTTGASQWDTTGNTSSIGKTNSTTNGRWHNSGYSASVARHLVCMVHP